MLEENCTVFILAIPYLYSMEVVIVIFGILSHCPLMKLEVLHHPSIVCLTTLLYCTEPSFSSLLSHIIQLYNEPSFFSILSNHFYSVLWHSSIDPHMDSF